MLTNFKITSVNPFALIAVALSVYLAIWGSTETVRLIGLAGIIYLSK